MTKMLIFFVLFLLLLSCSQVADKKVVYNDLNKLSLQWFQQAERQRLNHQFEKSLKSYDKAYKFSLLRNNLETQLFSLMRQALVYSKLNNQKISSDLLIQANNLITVEFNSHIQTYNLMKARVLANLGKKAEAKNLLFKYKMNFEEKEKEKEIYINWFEYELSKYPKPGVSLSDDFNLLLNAYQCDSLNNLEVLTYVGMSYLYLLIQENSEKVTEVSTKLLDVFEEQELPAKIKEIYEYMAVYHRNINNIKTSNYYAKKAKKIGEVLDAY
ncbi:hypothetical protein CWB72_19065 [Pseudoalteromonas phenolica]|uniref:hypothetical protein n=1 Tax=Pseudoalteromonas phenolica TaxID=161398 RepID=UPI00110B1FE9|nr:hypothetical protein [Pseudoalteromonas phenolica]TMN86674.1 hypothetical protein CWB72_19065 [Pseudoalteromonas phenolica]